MADEATTPAADEVATVEPQGDTEAAETDWKAKYERLLPDARKWERRAKAKETAAAAKAAEELDSLRRQVAEKDDTIARYEAARKAAEATAQVSRETGVPAALLQPLADLGADENDLGELAEAISQWAAKRPGNDPVTLGEEPQAKPPQDPAAAFMRELNKSQD